MIKIINNRGEGNCFFHAVHFGLMRQPASILFRENFNLLGELKEILVGHRNADGVNIEKDVCHLERSEGSPEFQEMSRDARHDIRFGEEETIEAYIIRLKKDPRMMDASVKLENYLSHENLRALAVEYLRQNQKLLEDFPPENENANDYLIRMAKLGTFAEGPIISALEEVLQIAFIIHNNKFFCLKEENLPVIGLFLQNEHYQTILFPLKPDVSELKNTSLSLSEVEWVPTWKIDFTGNFTQVNFRRSSISNYNNYIGMTLVVLGIGITIASLAFIAAIPVYISLVAILGGMINAYFIGSLGVASGVGIGIYGKGFFATKERENDVVSSDSMLSEGP